MTDLLKEILLDKRRELQSAMKSVPLKELISRCEKILPGQPHSFLRAVTVPGRLSIIAEMKRQSPSAGRILRDFNPAAIAGIYEKGGAAAISVLTDKKYFMGSGIDLAEARTACTLPVLRKDFIMDPYQVYQSRLWGASALLLIVRILSKREFKQLLNLTGRLNMDALVEIHTEDELETALNEDGVRCIGINNRNLSDLNVDLETTFKFLRKIPNGTAVIAESGIKRPETVKKLKTAGVSGALIGEAILGSKNMLKTLQSFVRAGNV